jgi:hypothetical protein
VTAHRLVFSFTDVTALLGSGFQRQTLPFLRVPELSEASTTNFSKSQLTGWPTIKFKVQVKVILRPTVSLPVLVSGHRLGPVTKFSFLEILFRQLQICYYGLCSLKLLLAFASVVFRGTHGQILLSQIWGSPNVEDQVPVFTFLIEGSPALPPGIGFLLTDCQIQSQQRSVGQSVLVSGHHVGPVTNLICNLQLVLSIASAVFLGSGFCGIHDKILLSQIWNSSRLVDQVPVFISSRNKVAQLYPPALSMYMSFTYARLLSVQARYSRLYSTKVKIKIILRPTVSRSVCLGVRHLSGNCDQFFFFFIICKQLRIFLCGAPSLTRGRGCSLQLLVGLASAVFLGPESHGTHNHLFTASNLRSLTWKSISLYLFHPGTGLPSYTPQVLGCLTVSSFNLYIQKCNGQFVRDLQSPKVMHRFRCNFYTTLQANTRMFRCNVYIYIYIYIYLLYI